MKYKVEQNNQGSRTLWVVKKGNKIVSHHEYEDQAFRAAQGYVEDDNWNASNRD